MENVDRVWAITTSGIPVSATTLSECPLNALPSKPDTIWAPLGADSGLFSWHDLVTLQRHRSDFGRSRGIYLRPHRGERADQVVDLLRIPLYLSDAPGERASRYSLDLYLPYRAVPGTQHRWNLEPPRLVFKTSRTGAGESDPQRLLVYDGAMDGRRLAQVVPWNGREAIYRVTDPYGGTIDLRFANAGGNAVLQRVDCPREFTFGYSKDRIRNDLVTLVGPSALRIWDLPDTTSASRAFLERLSVGQSVASPP